MKCMLVTACLLLLVNAPFAFAAAEMSLVYAKEDTGADIRKPLLPAFGELPSIAYLPDPFMKADGTGRITTREEWRGRRAEIRAMLEQYVVGEKPGKPGTIKATLNGNTIDITVGAGAETLEMTATIN